ncbi:hypothetical protein [Caudoviricetes sp.]|nr:hypothetical protein [Caudoviricetes sp.]
MSSVFRAADFTHIDSSFVSKYYHWFCELGYPQLDIAEYNDGEWAIIEMENAPVMPSYTRHRVIFRGFRHMEPCRSLVKKLIDMIDLQRDEVMAAHEKRSEELAEQKEKINKERAEAKLNAFKLLTKNEDLKERIAQNGSDELRLDVLAKRIPEHQLRRVLGSTVKHYT